MLQDEWSVSSTPSGYFPIFQVDFLQSFIVYNRFPEIMVEHASTSLSCFVALSFYLGPSNPALPSLALPVRPQQPAAILILLWAAAATPLSLSPSHWLRVLSVRPGGLGELGPDVPGWEDMVRKMWFRFRRKSPPAAFSPKLPFRRTMRVLADLAGRDL